ncbi:MAG: periplasmic protein [Brevundimonas sp.]|nr:periplasmic protein [Brevundimonas sp.]
MRMVLASAALAGLIWAGMAAAPGGTAEAASFNCARAGTPSERAICGSRALEDRDVEMATSFGLIRPVFAMGGRGAFMDEQSAWLVQRNRCGGDRTCLTRRYDERIAALRQTYRNSVLAQTDLYR